MVTDQQVALLRQRRMEGRQQTAPMAERSARKWQCGPLPSETKQERRWRTRPDPFDGVWEDAAPAGARPPAGSGQRQLSSGWRRNSPAELRCSPRTGGHSTVRSGGLLPPGAARLHPLQLSGSNHRRPALPPPAVPVGVEPFRVALRRVPARPLWP